VEGALPLAWEPPLRAARIIVRWATGVGPPVLGSICCGFVRGSRPPAS